LCLKVVPVHFRFTLFSFLLLVSFCVRAQPTNQRFSAPLKLSLESWNKVIQLPNGNTMLIHLREKQPIIVKVFDTAGTEQAHKEHITKQFNVRALERAAFRGMFPEGNDLLLLFEQEYFFKNALFRLRFSGSTGQLLAEEIVGYSDGMRVLQRDGVPGYAVLFFNGVSKHGSERHGKQSHVVRYTADGKAGQPVFFHCSSLAGKDLKGGELLTAETQPLLARPLSFRTGWCRSTR
jgi:hypothetical protein